MWEALGRKIVVQAGPGKTQDPTWKTIKEKRTGGLARLA
jgi:hypothetical protein